MARHAVKPGDSMPAACTRRGLSAAAWMVADSCSPQQGGRFMGVGARRVDDRARVDPFRRGRNLDPTRERIPAHDRGTGQYESAMIPNEPCEGANERFGFQN